MILPNIGLQLFTICADPIIEAYRPSHRYETYQEVRFLIGYCHRLRHGACVLSDSS